MKMKTYITAILFVSSLIGAGGIYSVYRTYQMAELSNDNFMEVQLGLTNIKFIKEDINRIITTCDLIFNSSNGHNVYLIQPSMTMIKNLKHRLNLLPVDLVNNQSVYLSFGDKIDQLSEILLTIKKGEQNGDEYDEYESISFKIISLYKVIASDAAKLYEKIKLELDDNKNILFHRVLIFISLYILFLISLGGFTSRIIVRPVRELSEKTSLLVSGESEDIITPSGPLELQLLGEHFTKLINSETDKRHELVKKQMEIKTLLLQASEEKEKLEEILIELHKVSESRDHFLSAMSHELRTPLNLIIGYSEALLDDVYGELTDKQLEVMEISYQSSQRLLSLISNTLEYSRLLSGDMRLNPEEAEVTKIVEQIWDRLKKTYVQKNIEFQYTIIDRTLTFKINVWVLQTLLFNLLDNAFKFSYPGGSVSLHIDEIDEDLWIVVSDAGLGVPYNLVEQIKVPFYQVDHGLNRQHDGTGLGLSIVSEIIKNQKGQLNISTGLNQGMKVTVELPIA